MNAEELTLLAALQKAIGPIHIGAHVRGPNTITLSPHRLYEILQKIWEDYDITPRKKEVV